MQRLQIIMVSAPWWNMFDIFYRRILCRVKEKSNTFSTKLTQNLVT